MEDQKQKNDSVVGKVSNLIVTNQYAAILIALGLIIIGIFLDQRFVEYDWVKHSSYNILIKIFSRLLISMGEATLVFFLIQVTIEGKRNKMHFDQAKTALEDFSNEVKAATQQTLSAIKQQGFKDFLNKTYPAHFTDKIMKADFFGFKVLRTETFWTYKVKKNSEGHIELIEEIKYKIQNLTDIDVHHIVTLETFKTNESNPEIAKISITYPDGKINEKESKELGELLKKVKEGEVYKQEEIIAANSYLIIEKVVKNIYKEKSITDFHYPSEHSLNLNIAVQFLSPMEEIDFKFTVPFLKSNDSSEHTSERADFECIKSGLDTLKYKAIPLVFKGQSIMYEIKLKS